MRYKLMVPWTAKLPLNRWIFRRHDPLKAALAALEQEHRVLKIGK